MASRIYTLYKAFTASADGAVSVQMVASGTVRCVQWRTHADLDADGEVYTIELAYVPIFQSNTHDSQGVLSAVCEFMGLTTSGSQIARTNVCHPLNYPIKSGEKLYLNGILTGVGVVNATAIVTVS